MCVTASISLHIFIVHPRVAGVVEQRYIAGTNHCQYYRHTSIYASTCLVEFRAFASAIVSRVSAHAVGAIAKTHRYSSVAHQHVYV